MDDYSYAAEQVKEGIISHYLKENPGVQRHEVITKTVNGKIVVSTIQETFDAMEGRNKSPDLQQLRNQKILNELARGGDERYAECLQSIANSNKYIDWLSLSKFSGFSQQDKADQTEYLNRHAAICSERALDLLKAKQNFVKTLKNEIKPSASAINTNLLEYLEAVSGQLKAQRSIFKREVDLGDRFSSAVMQFFSTQFSGIRARPDPAAVRAIARSISILRDNQIQMPEIENKKDMKAFDGALKQLQDKLGKRREQFDGLQKLLDYLEKSIEEIKASLASATPEKPAGNDSRRMAFTTRKHLG